MTKYTLVIHPTCPTGFFHILADALHKYDRDIESAFQYYNKNLNPFIGEVQATEELNVRQSFIPRTEEAIRKRNSKAALF